MVIKLLNDGHTVVGLDNINEYYDKNLKFARLKYAGIISDLEDGNSIDYNTIL